MDTPKEVVVQRYTTKDLSRLYNVSWKTMQKWLRLDEHAIGKKTGHFYSAKQVRQLFQLRGYPKITISPSHY